MFKMSLGASTRRAVYSLMSPLVTELDAVTINVTSPSASFANTSPEVIEKARKKREGKYCELAQLCNLYTALTFLQYI